MAHAYLAMYWPQFVALAAAHFLALVSPGPDFLLVLRSALRSRLRGASGCCLGIALGNLAYIALAIAGFGLLQRHPAILAAARWAGCAWLAYLGLSCLRHPSLAALPQASGSAVSTPSWLHELGQGLVSALLNPKNALFYAGLFAVVEQHHTPLVIKLGYGVWMFAAVLLWDLAIAWAAAHPRLLRQFGRSLGRIERATGCLLIVLSLSIVVREAL